MTSSQLPADDSREQALRQARQRIVEIQAVRDYLQQSNSAGSRIAELDARLKEALALEQTLIKSGPPRRRSAKARFLPVIASLLLLGTSSQDETALALLTLVLNGPLSVC